MTSLPKFHITPAFTSTHPGVSMGFLLMDGLVQPEAFPDLLAEKTRLEEELRRRFPDRAALRAHPLVRDYLRYYRRFGWNYTVAHQVETVALKGREIPVVVPLVTAMFMAELKSLVLVAGHDLAALKGDVRVDAGTGTERYVGLGKKDCPVKEGEAYMADEEDIIAAVLYGPDHRTRFSRETLGGLWCAYGAPGVPPGALAGMLEEMARLARIMAPEARLLSLDVLTA